MSIDIVNVVLFMKTSVVLQSCFFRGISVNNSRFCSSLEGYICLELVPFCIVKLLTFEFFRFEVIFKCWIV